MNKEIAVKKSKLKRWERMQGVSIEFPEPTAAPSVAEPVEKVAPPDIPGSYPRLRTLLNDLNLPFQVNFTQAGAAPIIGRSSRTIQGWTSKGLIPCHYWPTDAPYYTAQDLEDYLSARERRNNRRTKGDK